MSTSDNESDEDNKVYKAGHTKITIDCDGELRLDHTAFNKFLADSKIGDKPFCIISICGAAREGKSFMMNLILRHFEKQTWQTDNSSTDKGGTFRMTPFRVNKGPDAITAGILLYNYIFEVKTKNGDKMAVILMDTQGIFQPDAEKATEDFLLTVTTLMSSVQILNVFRTCDATRLDAMKSAITYGELSSVQDRYLKLQDLIVLIRDVGDTMTKDECENQLKKLIMDETICGKQSTAARAKIRKAFSHVQLYGLPSPGKKVAKLTMETHYIKYNDIDKDFLDSVDEFLANAINPLERLAPKFTNDRKPIKFRDLYKLMRLCDDHFKEAVKDSGFDAQKILEAEDRVAYENKFEELYMEFVDEIKKVVGETEEAIKNPCNILSRKTLEKFSEEVSQWKVSDGGKQYEAKYARRLKEQMQNAISTHVLTVICLEAREKLKLETESHRRFEDYVTSMENCDTLHKLRTSHDAFMSKLKGCTPMEYDEQKLMGLIMDKYAKLEQTIRKREQEDSKAEKLRKNVNRYKSDKSSMEYKQSVEDLRIQMIESTLDQLEDSMRGVWIEFMNKKANNKHKPKSQTNLLPRPEVVMETWRQTKSLSLDAEDIEDIYSHVKSKVLGEYWTSNLEDIEIWSINELNRKLFKEWESKTKIQQSLLRSKSCLPLYLPFNDFRKEIRAEVGHHKDNIVYGTRTETGEKFIPDEVEKENYRRVIQSVVEEFQKCLTTDKSLAICQSGQMDEDYLKKHAQTLASMHEMYLEQMFPAQADGYRRVIMLLENSKEEIVKMRQEIQEDIKMKLTIYMRVVVSAAEEQYHKIMAGTHYVQENIKEAYMNLLDEGFEKIYRDFTDGNEIITEVKDEVYEKAGVKESLEKMLKRNKTNEGELIDTGIPNIPKPEPPSIIDQFFAFIKSQLSRFKKKN